MKTYYEIEIINEQNVVIARTICQKELQAMQFINNYIKMNVNIKCATCKGKERLEFYYKTIEKNKFYTKKLI